MNAMLSNLLARAPKIDDLIAVTELLEACDIADNDLPGRTKEDILADWDRPEFSPDTEAWVIITTDRRLVGYAHVWPCSSMQNSVFASVHPEYRNRGIGMLLLRLAEARVREQINEAPSSLRITMTSVVSHLNEAARHFLEREGYSPLRQFWRLIVDMEGSPYETSSQSGKLKLDLPVDTTNPVGTTAIQTRTGIYVARQYDVYEKELRPGAVLPAGEQLMQQCLAA